MNWYLSSGQWLKWVTSVEAPGYTLVAPWMPRKKLKDFLNQKKKRSNESNYYITQSVL